MLSNLSVKKPHLIVVIILVVLLLGGVAVANTTVDFLPNINLPYIVVATICPGLTPSEVEEQLTIPTESAVRKLSSVASITSTSSEHYCLLVIELNSDADIDSSAFDLQSSLSNIKSSLPSGTLDSVILKLNPSMLPIMQIAVSEQGKNSAESSDYLKSIADEILNVKGVASVDASGVVENMLLVMMSEQKLAGFISSSITPNRDSYFVTQLDVNGNPIIDGDGNPVKVFDEEAYNSAVESGVKLGQKVSTLVSENLTNEVLGKAIYAQNLELPAGSLNYGNGSLVLKIGDKIGSLEEFSATPIITLNFESAFKKYGDAINLFKGAAISQSMLDALIDASNEAGVYKTTLGNIIKELASPSTSDYFETVSDGKYKLTSKALGNLKIYGDSITAVSGFQFPSAKLADLDQLINGFESFVKTSGLFEQVTTDEGGAALAEPFWRLKSSLVGDGNFVLNAYETLSAKVFSTTEIAGFKSTVQRFYDLGDTLNVLGTTSEGYLKESGYFKKVYKKDELGNTVTTPDADGNPIPVIDYYKVDDSFINGIRNLPSATLKLSDAADIVTLNTAGVAHNLVNGEGGIIVSVTKQAGFSTVEVADGVLNYLNTAKTSNANLSYLTLYNQGQYANDMINSIILNICLGALFVIIILFLFLRDIKPTLVVASSIVLSVAAAFACMYFAGINLNILSMSGLCISIGMLVDNSIVALENIYRLRAACVDTKKASIDGARQIGGAIFASTLTTIIMFAPLLFVDGLTVTIFKDVALTLAFSLAASLLVALTFVPMISSKVLGGAIKQPTKAFNKLSDGYVRSLKFLLNKKCIALVVVVVLFGGSLTGVFFMDRVFFPSSEGNYLSMTVSINKTELPERYTYDEAVDLIINSIVGQSEESGYTKDVGVALTGGMKVGGYSVEQETIKAYIVLNDKIKKDASEVGEELSAKVKAELTELVLPESCYEIEYNSDSGMLSGLVEEQTLSVKVSGSDMAAMRKTAAALASKLGELEGTTVDNGIGEVPMEYYIEVDKQKASSLIGLTVGELMLKIANELSAVSPSTSVTYEDTGDAYKVYVYSAAYQTTRWYKVKNAGGDEVKLYIAHDGSFYLPIEDNGETKKIAVSKDATSNSFSYELDGQAYTLTAAEGELIAYYTIGRAQPLDVLTYRLSNVVLSGTDLQYSVNVPLYKLLTANSFKRDENGDIIYRKHLVENAFGTPELVNVLDDEGNPIPAEIALREGYQTITRTDGSREITIKVAYDGVGSNKIERQIEGVVAGFAAEEGVEVSYVGENLIVQNIYKDLYLVLGIGILLVYLVMAAQFRSFKLPLMVMVTIPLAFTGSILLMLICGIPLSVMAIIGLIILMGIIVNNGIVYVTTVNDLIEQGATKREAIFEAAKGRLRPILMTAATTIVGLLAVAINGGADGAMFQPMAIATIGGLTYGTLLTLLLMPLLCDLFYGKKPDKKLLAAEAENAENQSLQPSENA